jgi:hypothetical protein
MLTQQEQAPARNGSLAVTVARKREQRAIETTANAAIVPGPARTNKPQVKNPGFAEAMKDHDQALQNKLVLLLSTLEQLCIHLENALATGEVLAALDVARAIVDGVVAVADQLDTKSGNSALATALADAGHLYSTLDRLRKDFAPSPWRSLLAVFGTPQTSSTQKRQELVQTMTDTVRVVATFLSLFRTQLRSARAAQDWEQAQALFLRELRRVVETLHL